MNELYLTLPGSIRSKKNSKQVVMVGGKNKPRRPMILPSKSYQAWETPARKYLWGYAIVPPLTVPVWVEVHVYFCGPQPDLSGCLESIGDCLEGIIYANDKQIYSWDGSRLHHDKENPHTDIVVRWEATEPEAIRDAARQAGETF